MNYFRIKSWETISKKFPQIFQSMNGLTFSEVFQNLDSQHPITIINFYLNTCVNLGANPETNLENIKEVIKDYCEDRIDFNDLREVSKDMLGGLWDVFHKQNLLDKPFTVSEDLVTKVWNANEP